MFHKKIYVYSILSMARKRVSRKNRVSKRKTSRRRKHVSKRVSKRKTSRRKKRVSKRKTSRRRNRVSRRRQRGGTWKGIEWSRERSWAKPNALAFCDSCENADTNHKKTCQAAYDTVKGEAAAAAPNISNDILKFLNCLSLHGFTSKI